MQRGELDRVLERELGARADREVRRVRGVAHQHHAARGRCAWTQLWQTTRGKRIHCAEPRRWLAFDISGWPSRYFGEQLLAERDRFVLLHRRRGRPRARRVSGRLDDEGRGVVVEAVGVGLEPAVRGLLEGEREGLEAACGCRARRSGTRAGRCRAGRSRRSCARMRLFRPSLAMIRSASGYCASSCTSVSNRSSTPSSSQRACRMLSSALAADAAEAVAAGADLAAADVDLDVVPVVERIEDLRGASSGSAVLQVAERLVGEHDAPAEGVVGPVALDDRRSRARDPAASSAARSTGRRGRRRCRRSSHAGLNS